MRKLLIASLLLLSACAGQQSVSLSAGPLTGPVSHVDPISTDQAPTDPLQALSKFTVSDLQAASADAKAQVPADVTAAQCYDYLAGVIPTIQVPNGQQTVGVFVAFQKARDLARGTSASGGWLTAFNIACAPLATDVRLTLAKFGLLSAGVAATGGALAPALPGLGALGAALPIPLP